MLRFLATLLTLVIVSFPAAAAVITFGDQDCFGMGCYGAADPTAGATLQGLAPNAVTFATTSFGHGYPFLPGAGDFPGTDRIYVGSTQTGAHDGYSTSVERINGPQTFVLNYASLVPSGQTVVSLTLGIAADDFQFPSFGQPFTATVNGASNSTLVNTLQGLSQSGPLVQFFTVGLSTALDTPAHSLTLSINEGGDGGDGWAVDFLTIGVTTTPVSPGVPEPGTFLLLLGSTTLLFGRRVLLRRGRSRALRPLVF